MNLGKPVNVTIGTSVEKVVFEELTSRNETKGIVFESSWNQLTEEEIKTELIAEGYDIKHVRQMTKKDQKGEVIKTGAVVITLDAEKLPERIKLCGVSYRIRQYYPNPLICGRCLKIGHVKAKCQSEHETCRECGEGKQAMHECVISPVCPNCQPGDNNHKPNDKNCGAINFEKCVINYRINNKSSIFEAQQAVKEILEKKNQACQMKPPTSTHSNPEQSIQNKTFAEQMSYYENKTRLATEETERLREQIKIYEAKIAERDATLELLVQTRKREAQFEKQTGKRARSRSRSKETQLDVSKLSIAKTTTQIPKGSHRIDEITMEEYRSQMTQGQKDKMTDRENKAQQKNSQLNWYIISKEPGLQ